MLKAVAMAGLVLTAASAKAQQIDVPRRPGVALGIAANNPLNLSRSPDAVGYALDRDGNHVAVYPSLRHGVNASWQQLISYQREGLVTPRQMITRWVCGSRCTPEQTAVIGGYTADVAAAVHARPDDPIDVRDPATAVAFMLAAQPHETGGAHFSAAADTASATATELPPPPCAAPSYDTWGQAECRRPHPEGEPAP